MSNSWQQPEQEAFYTARDYDNYHTVRLDAYSTKFVWDTHRSTREGKPDPPFILFDFDGLIRGHATHWEICVSAAMGNRWCIFGMAKRRASRPVWTERTALADRKRQNAVFEPVYIFGYNGIIEGWEDRPRVRLFSND